MGIGFILFGFPLLIVLTIGLIVYFAFTKDKKAIWAIGIIYGLALLLFGLWRFLDYHSRHMAITKADIVGEYRIDTTFYPGPNARWQYAHYRFSLRKSDSIVLIETGTNGRTQKVFWYKLKYAERPTTVLWGIQADTTSHILRNPPTLYRSHDRFYYVFRSPLFGNMFFRKLTRAKTPQVSKSVLANIMDTTLLLIGISLVVTAIIVYRKTKRKYSTWIKATARVVDHREDLTDDGNTVQENIFTFTDHQGTERRLPEGFASSIPTKWFGEEFQIIYDPNAIWEFKTTTFIDMYAKTLYLLMASIPFFVLPLIHQISSP